MEEQKNLTKITVPQSEWRYGQMGHDKLVTYGVATCIAVAVKSDDEIFLAHLDVTTDVYEFKKQIENFNSNDCQAFIIGGWKSNIFSRVLGKMAESLLTEKGCEVDSSKLLVNDGDISNLLISQVFRAVEFDGDVTY